MVQGGRGRRLRLGAAPTATTVGDPSIRDFLRLTGNPSPAREDVAKVHAFYVRERGFALPRSRDVPSMSESAESGPAADAVVCIRDLPIATRSTAPRTVLPIRLGRCGASECLLATVVLADGDSLGDNPPVLSAGPWLAG